MPPTPPKHARLQVLLLLTAACALLACGVPAIPQRQSEGPAGVKLILVNDMPGAQPLRGAVPFLVVYDNMVPGSESGTIDIPKTIAAIRRQSTLPEYGMLDFENPYSEVLKVGESHPKYATVLRSLVETIRAVRREFPRTRWTYWGFPEIPFWLDGESGATWATASKSSRDAAVRRAVRSSSAVLLECDWISPWAYDLYDRRTAAKPEFATGESDGTRAWIEAKIAIARACFEEAGRPARPIIPCVSALYAPGGRATADEPVPLDEFTADLVTPILRARVDGIALWHPIVYFLREATSPINGATPAIVSEKRQWVRRHLLQGADPLAWNRSNPPGEAQARELLQRYVDAIARASP